MQILRTLVFNVLFYLWTAVVAIGLIPALFWVNGRAILFGAWIWAKGTLWLVRVICGITTEIRGAEKIGPGAVLVAAKHQSSLEVFSLLAVFRRPAVIYKRELGWIPVFGWLVWRSGQIAVHRGKKAEALASIARGAQVAKKDDRQILIFPEGTRRKVDAPPDYRYGVTHLYGELGLPCLPVACNSGLFWARRTMAHQPGPFVMEILDPLPADLPPEEFAARLQEAIETATDKLVAEGRARTGL